MAATGQPAETRASRPEPGLFQDLLTLSKFRLLTLVLIATAMGYYFAYDAPFQVSDFIAAILGVTAVGGSANALNQWYERDCDSRMNRTRDRPLPSGRMQSYQALSFGLIMAMVGLVILALGTNMLTMWLAFASWASYLFIYTPMKRISLLNTWVGAVPGALPAALGCTAASGELNLEAISLFIVLYVWQMPHFFAISWMYREDYARGGFRMLSEADPQGIATSTQILSHTFLLLLASISLFFLSDAGLIYLFSAILAGLASFFFAINFYMQRTDAHARGVFRMSLIYLPILFLALIVDRLLN